ncbi:MAG: DUF5060 domain-containing protein [Fimbriimonas sp.]
MMLIPYLLAAPQAPVATPYAQRARHEIRRVTPAATEVPRYEMLEVDVDLTGTFDNPFDPADVALEALVAPPNGEEYVVPGYFDRPYARREENGEEKLEPAGPPRWRIRLAPLVEGRHRVTVRLRDRTGNAVPQEFTFEATPARAAGFIGVSPRDRRYFEFADGKPYFPIGANTGWAGAKGTADFDRWFPEYGKVGANYGRLWLSPAWTTFALEQAGKPEEGKGLGQFDLANAWRLDHVMGLAREHGLYLMLCIDSYNVLRSEDAHPYWEKTPHNADNGGPLRIWSDFWTAPQMDRLYRNKLRYLVARYGAMRNVFAWEFWNEVDLTRDFAVEPVQAWHQRMATALKDLDPYDHLVATSTANTMGVRDLERLPELDFFQTHHYGSPDLATTVAIQQSRKAWGKPHLIGEIGADAGGPREDVDPKGHQIHDPMWASVATGVAGAAMPWWWDNLIDPKGLYPLFGSVAKFVEGVDFPAEAFQQTKPVFGYAGKGVRPRRDLSVVGQPAVWAAHPLNRPRTLTVKDGQVTGGQVSEAQHGVTNHPAWHNPVLFKLYLDRPTRFEVEVSRVSGYGGATLRIEMDGGRVLTRDFRDPDGNQSTADLNQYAGAYGITVPAGYHTVKVENVGADWFMASYRLVGAKPGGERPPLVGWSVVGNQTALAWVRVEGRTWPRVAVIKRPPPASPPSVMRLNGLASGSYSAVLWNTWSGRAERTVGISVGVDGIARVPLPKIEDDLAIKLIRRPR